MVLERVRGWRLTVCEVGETGEKAVLPGARHLEGRLLVLDAGCEGLDL